MSDQNPYAAPKAPLDPDPKVKVSEDTCPKCKGTNVHRPGFTWWGGAIGPRLLSHAVCRGCGFGFNWKTGRSNTNGIIIYTVVILVVVGAIFIALRH
jgi:transposase-like protein